MGAGKRLVRTDEDIRVGTDCKDQIPEVFGILKAVAVGNVYFRILQIHKPISFTGFFT